MLRDIFLGVAATPPSKGGEYASRLRVTSIRQTCFGQVWSMTAPTVERIVHLQAASSPTIFATAEFCTPPPPNGLRPRPDLMKKLVSSDGSVETLAQNVSHLLS